MGAKKKHYHYDKRQFLDKKYRLLFLMEEVPDENGKTTYYFVDCYNSPCIFYDLSTNLREIRLTYKHIVEAVCGYYGLSHNNAKGFSVAIRSEAIHSCLNECYKDVNERYKPSIDNLADIFGISEKNVISEDKRHQKTYLKEAKSYLLEAV